MITDSFYYRHTISVMNCVLIVSDTHIARDCEAAVDIKIATIQPSQS